MNLVQFLSVTCSDLGPVLSLVKTFIKIICWGIPIILVVMIILDIAKIVTTGEADEKLTKATTKKVVTRIIYALIIFLVPFLIDLIFSIVSSDSSEYDERWYDCWKQTESATINVGDSCYGDADTAFSVCKKGVDRNSSGQYCCK